MAGAVYVGVTAAMTLPGAAGAARWSACSPPRRSSLPRVVPGWESLDDFVPQLLLATFAAYGVGQVLERNVELAQAREQLVELAVTQERERLARDVHDILGHSLTVITVKTELAGRLLEAVPADPAAGPGARRGRRRRAAGPRGAGRRPRHRRRACGSVSLTGELAAARQALDAAGIAADLPSAVDDVPARLPRAVRLGAARGRHERRAALRREPVRACALTADCARGARRRPRARRRPAAAPGWPGCASGRRRSARRVETGRAPEGGFLLRVTRSVIRLLLADDQALVRGALAALLDLEPDLEVVAEVGRGDEVVRRGGRAPGRRRAARRRDARAGRDRRHRGAAPGAARRAGCSIVTTFGRPGYLRRAMEAGASGFVVKDTPARQLADAVRRVHAGLRVLDPALAEESLVSGASPLTARETEVLRAARDGGTVADLAAVLHLSEGTVRNHLSAAIGKTGARNRAEAVRSPRQHGWLAARRDASVGGHSVRRLPWVA